MSAKEKWEILRGPGGARAALFYALKTLARIEVFEFMSVDATQVSGADIPQGISYLPVATPAAAAALPPGLREMAETQSGLGVGALVESGGSLHLLLRDGELAAQLTIMPGPACMIGDPPACLAIGEANAFLSYLYGWPAHRRRGLARLLVQTAVSQLGAQGVRQVVAHVRATNVPSQATFARCGWRRRAKVLCTLHGRILLKYGIRDAGIGLAARGP